MVPTKKKRFPKEVPVMPRLSFDPRSSTQNEKNHLPHGEVSRPKKTQRLKRKMKLECITHIAGK
jgi:hypothetical protein